MSFGKMALWSIETIVIIAIVFAVQMPMRKKRLPVLRTEEHSEWELITLMTE